MESILTVLKMNIALIGFRGTGKTVISRLLAGVLDKKLVSMDEEILKRTKLSPEKFVKKYGWDKFLELESEIVERISDLDDCIFDTSHSIVLRNENIINLKKNSLVMFLTSDQKTLIRRIKGSKPGFPKNIDLENIGSIFKDYESRYISAADYTIDTSSLSPEEICSLIAHFIQMEIQ